MFTREVFSLAALALAVQGSLLHRWQGQTATDRSYAVVSEWGDRLGTYEHATLNLTQPELRDGTWHLRVGEQNSVIPANGVVAFPVSTPNLFGRTLELAREAGPSLKFAIGVPPAKDGSARDTVGCAQIGGTLECGPIDSGATLCTCNGPGIKESF